MPAEYMVIGEAPGEEEERAGVPFVGRAGMLLQELLDNAGIADKTFVDNVVHCRPPGNRRPTVKEMRACLPRVVKTLSEVRPRLVILLGDTALKAFFPGKVLGRSIASRLTMDVCGRQQEFLVSYHPAGALRRPQWMKAIKALFAGIVAIEPELEAVGKYVAVDSEWQGEKVFTVKTTGEIKPDSVLVLHNAKSDMKLLPELRGRPFEDTMLMAHLLGLPLGLKNLYHYITGKSLRTLPEILGVGKKAVRMEERAEEVETYCQGDADATMLVFQQLLPKVKAQGLEKLYRDFDLPLVPWLLRIEENGLPIDRKFLGEMKGQLERGRQVQLDRLGINPRSRPQLLKRMEEIGLHSPLQTGKGGEAWNKEAMTLLEMTDLPPEQAALLKTLSRFRKADKLLTTYVNPWLESGKDRIYPEYNQCGTETARLSSSNPNGQNLARGPLRRAIAAPPGMVILEWDASQLEMRVMAGMSGDKAMIDGYKRGVDLHTNAAMLLWGDADKKHRYDAKRANFAMAYGGGVGVLMEKLGLSYEAAVAFHRRYFQAFPQLKEWFDALLAEAFRTGIVYNAYGRPRYIPALLSANKYERSKAGREAANMPIQSTAADIVKRVMIDVLPEIIRDGGEGIGQIHDSILALSDIALVKARVERWNQLFEQSINTYLPNVPLAMNLSIYRTWNRTVNLSAL